MKSGAAVQRAASAPGVADSRKAILLRVALATIALLILAVALWVLDRDQDDAQVSPSAPSAPSASGRVADVVQGTPAPPLPPGTPENATTTPAADVPAPQQAAEPPPDPTLPAASRPTPETGPLAMESAALQAGAGATAASVTGAAVASPTPPAELPVDSPVSSMSPAQTAAPDEAHAPKFEPAPPPGPGFLVQLGVFVDTGKAENLRRELARKGYPAHLQARVVLGPFPNRQAALAAQEKIRRERKLDGIILPPRKP